MTEVMSISSTPRRDFSSSSLPRPSSQPSLFLDNQGFARPGASPSISSTHQIGYELKPTCSVTSSAPSSPQFTHRELSHRPSYASTPASSLSLHDQFCADEDDDTDIQFPSYDDTSKESGSFQLQDNGAASSADSSRRTSTSEAATKDGASRLHPIGDDTAVESLPSQHVDYLSHKWREEDIWSSWKHIVGKRRTLENWERLENASWRTWAKSKYRLNTVSPEQLNWMKDHDVTWLYGPLQLNQTRPRSGSPNATSRFSRTDSLIISKKSILKKRTKSELLLKRAFSSSTLVQQAVDSIVSQGGKPDALRHPAFSDRTISGYDKPIAAVISPSFDPPTPFRQSSSTSGDQTPSGTRHIHFSDKVEQCIAINKDIYGPGDDDFAMQASEDDESSDDGMLMMKPERGKERKLGLRCGTPRNSFSSDSDNRTIAMLPSTTLKYRGDTPEPPEGSPRTGSIWGTGSDKRVVKSSSQETLKPSRPSSNFLLDDDDDDVDLSWQPSTSPSSSSTSVSSNSSRSSSVDRRRSMPIQPSGDEDEEMEVRGLRRTPSGMFMPYDEDEDEMGSVGLLGKVVDTVNTARDIAHVIWNVGWRR